MGSERGDRVGAGRPERWRHVKGWTAGIALGAGVVVLGILGVRALAGGAAAGASAASMAPPAASAMHAAVGVQRAPGADARAVVETASATVYTRHVRRAVDRLETLTVDDGGFVQQADIASGGARETALVVLRIPRSRWASALASLGDFGRLTNLTQSGVDVTAESTGLAVQIAAMTDEVAAYQRLFQQAGTLADMIQIEQALSQAEATLQSLQLQQAGLDRQVALGTLTVSLRPVVSVPPRRPPVPLARVWAGSLAALAVVGRGLLDAVVWISPWAAIVALVAGPLAWWRRRTRAAR